MTTPISTAVLILTEVQEKKKRHRLDDLIRVVSYKSLQELAQEITKPLLVAADWICSSLLSCKFESLDEDYELYVDLAVKIALVISKNFYLNLGARCLIHFARGASLNFPYSSVVALNEAYKLDCTEWKPILEVTVKISLEDARALEEEINKMRAEKVF